MGCCCGISLLQPKESIEIEQTTKYDLKDKETLDRMSDAELEDYPLDHGHAVLSKATARITRLQLETWLGEREARQRESSCRAHAAGG